MRVDYFGTDDVNFWRATSLIRESFFGRGGNDRFEVFHHEEGLGISADFSDRFFGGGGQDTLDGLVFDFTVDATVNDYRQLSFDGGTGYDTVSADIRVAATGGDTLALSSIRTSVRSVEHWNYDVELVAAEQSGTFALRANRTDDTLNILQSTDTLNEVIVVDTLGGDDVINYQLNAMAGDLQVTTGNGADSFVFNGLWNASCDLTVSTGRGTDTVVINGSTISNFQQLDVRVTTGSGSDTIVLEGMHSETLNAGGGNDHIYVLTGSFANNADVIRTGSGRDRLYIELDEYSTVAIIQDFSANKDVFVFDRDENSSQEPRSTDVTFNRAEWQRSEESILFMDNDQNRLYFGENVLVEFRNDVELTAANFVTDNWEYWS